MSWRDDVPLLVLQARELGMRESQSFTAADGNHVHQVLGCMMNYVPDEVGTEDVYIVQHRHAAVQQGC